MSARWSWRWWWIVAGCAGWLAWYAIVWSVQLTPTTFAFLYGVIAPLFVPSVVIGGVLGIGSHLSGRAAERVFASAFQALGLCWGIVLGRIVIETLARGDDPTSLPWGLYLLLALPILYSVHLVVLASMLAAAAARRIRPARPQERAG